ncbi:MAG: transposase [Gammaproteobacteria bacterium]|nr:MAG: transposase [Gammaproteobacteria bacterium]
MTQPRKNIVSVTDTPYYHCIGRCVRRAFLCGEDEFSGKSFEHRRQWIVDRLNHLASTFAIDICAYSVMSNHYHLVLRLSPSKSKSWSKDDVIKRWQNIYTGGDLVRVYQSGKTLTKEQNDMLDIKIKLWKARLSNLSWFMRCLNEHIAVMANKEDECTGRFWEGRFKSQALLDEAALISCMTYVELNPIRANIAKTPESSLYTSIRERILQNIGKPHGAKALLPMEGDKADCHGLPFHLMDYLELIDWTGRAIRDGKKGKIQSHLPPILQRLEFDSGKWMAQQNHFGKRRYLVVGCNEKIRAMASRIGVKWMNGQGSPFWEPGIN